MPLGAAATVCDSLLDPVGDFDYLATYLTTDWEHAPILGQESDSLASELLDLSNHSTEVGEGSSTDKTSTALPSGNMTTPDILQQCLQTDQVDKRQMKLKQSRESQKRSRERQKVC